MRYVQKKGQDPYSKKSWVDPATIPISFPQITQSINQPVALGRYLTRRLLAALTFGAALNPTLSAASTCPQRSCRALGAFGEVVAKARVHPGPVQAYNK